MISPWNCGKYFKHKASNAALKYFYTLHSVRQKYHHGTHIEGKIFAVKQIIPQNEWIFNSILKPWNRCQNKNLTKVPATGKRRSIGPGSG